LVVVPLQASKERDALAQLCDMEGDSLRSRMWIAGIFW